VSRDRPPPSFEKKAHTEVRGSSREIRDHIHIESSGIGLQSIHIYVCVLCSLWENKKKKLRVLKSARWKSLQTFIWILSLSSSLVEREKRTENISLSKACGSTAQCSAEMGYIHTQVCGV
jgi:hypothetical protein